MWKHVGVFFVFTFCWSYIFSEPCTTPSGQSSNCISLYDCPELLAGLVKPMSGVIATYIRQSACNGRDSRGARVCCGPLPTTTTTTEPPITGIFPEDSLPAPAGQCGVDTNGDRIYGGEETELDEFRWMALLGYRNKSSGVISYQCGGSLINRRYVLTAGHCVTGMIVRVVGPLVTVRLGEYDTYKPVDCKNNICADTPQEIPVASTHPHPDYNANFRTSRNDIAIVRLAQRATYSFYVHPICLTGNTARNIDSDVVIAGWGKTPEQSHSNLKLKLAMPLVARDECTTKFRSSFGVNLGDSQLCAGGVEGKDSCKGDSGGPLMRQRVDGIWEAVGVLSYGVSPCARNGWPGVYTSVASYYDWIRSTLRSTNQ